MSGCAVRATTDAVCSVMPARRFHSPIIRNRANLQILFILGILGFSTAGCHHATGTAPLRAHPVPVAVRATETIPSRIQPASASVTADSTAITHVRTLPLWLQAQDACAKHRYADAAALLQKLAEQNGPSDSEREYCQTQVAVCRKDAGLPALPATSLAAVANGTSGQPLRPAQGSSDCGPRALIILCDKLGVKADLETVTRVAGTGSDGTTMEGLTKAVASVGLKAEGIQVGRNALPDTQLPAIGWYHGNHYVAVLELNGRGESGTATIRDPDSSKEETILQEALLRRTSGYLLLVHR